MTKALALACLLGVSLAAPGPALVARQFGGGLLGGATSDELLDGQCADIVFINARASTEPGNMGASTGPAVCRKLKEQANAICQGVGGAYNAGLATNALPGGSTQGAFDEAAGLIEQAATQCPDAKIVASGYSQGSAVMNGAISKLDPSLQDKIAGVVLFGYTRNAQENGGIANFPQDKVKVYCNKSDGVCGGALAVTPGHFGYGGDTDDAVSFLIEKANASPSSSSSTTPEAASSSSGTSSSSGSSSGSSLGGLGSFGGLGSLGSSGSSSGGLSSLGGLGSSSSGSSGLGSFGGLSSLGGSSSSSGGLGSFGGLGGLSSRGSASASDSSVSESADSASTDSASSAATSAAPAGYGSDAASDCPCAKR